MDFFFFKNFTGFQDFQEFSTTLFFNEILFCSTIILHIISVYFIGKNVENLLQRMFENELDVEDIGPSDIQNLEDETRPLSFST